MELVHPPIATAFAGNKILSNGAIAQVALAVKYAAETATALSEPILVFDDGNGRIIDLDLRGNDAEIVDRLTRHWPEAEAQSQHVIAEIDLPAVSEPRGRGRPKLGVVAREITLLPRHWDWLSGQPGGASVTLRRLVEDAKRSGGNKQQRRLAQEAAYRFMSAMAGDLPGYEETCRALFADDTDSFMQQSAKWPADIRSYAARLAGLEAVDSH